MPGYALTVAGHLPFPTIGEAMHEALKRGRAKSEAWQKNLENAASYFVGFMDLKHPEVQFWHQVSARHVYAYIEDQAGSGVASKTLKHYLTPILSTARYWHNENPGLYQNFSITHPALAAPREIRKRYLSPAQMARLLDEAGKSANPGVYAAVMLGGYAGLNLAEIVRLDASSFDLEASTLRIEVSKNEFRPRTIPLLPIVAAWAPEFRPTVQVGGKPATNDSLGKAVRRVLNKIVRDIESEADGLVGAEREMLLAEAKAFDELQPRDLRKSFANFCRAARVRQEATAAYLGHRQEIMTGLHYADFGELQYLREMVVAPVHEYLSK